MSESKSLHRVYGFRIDVYLLWLTSAAALIAGLWLPVITFTEFFIKNSTYTILGGILDLLKHREYVLASVIFVFSVVFPVTKLLALIFLWFIPINRNNRRAAIGRLAELGRWSMLDVYVVATTVVIAKSSALFKTEPKIGIYFFGASVILSILTSTWIEKLSKKIA